MHDEACPHYEDMINNMALGHEFLLSEFGVVPRIGWHLDPFGHSSANPRLFADMGFDSWLFARIDYQDKEKRESEESMNFLWRPFSKHFGDSKQIFTATMRDHYCWLDGFFYDERWDGSDPFVADESSDVYNAEEKMQQMLNYLGEMEEDYRGNHMLLPFGCDFSFANARLNFEQMDLIIDYVNANNDQNVHLFYSTPSQYIDALNAQNLTWPVRYDDMFPYADNPMDYWTGYFTSRQKAKQEVREGQAALHAANQIYSLKALDNTTSES
mmetsp:Transcript_3463/g.5887  ORF Transcript_3463/g.5887 Transcript_3463/m.5887 type:complete len:270 (+) Transcript_3463:445-1254(+)